MNFISRKESTQFDIVKMLGHCRHINKISINCLSALYKQGQISTFMSDNAQGSCLLRTETSLIKHNVYYKGKLSTCATYNTNTAILNEQENIKKDSTNNAEKVSEIKASPFESRDYFEVNKLFTIKDLFNARVHLGHTVRSMTPQMRPFIFGTRFDTCIFDLDETALLLKQALNFVAHIAHRGGIILFIARQPQIAHMVERTAIECGEYAQCRQWSTMAFTASNQVLY